MSVEAIFKEVPDLGLRVKQGSLAKNGLAAYLTSIEQAFSVAELPTPKERRQSLVPGLVEDGNMFQLAYFLGRGGIARGRFTAIGESGYPFVEGDVEARNNNYRIARGAVLLNSRTRKQFEITDRLLHVATSLITYHNQLGTFERVQPIQPLIPRLH